MICKIHEQYVPHLKDLKVGFNISIKLLRKFKVKRVLGWILKVVIFQQKWCNTHSFHANQKIPVAFHKIIERSLTTKFHCHLHLVSPSISQLNVTVCAVAGSVFERSQRRLRWHGRLHVILRSDKGARAATSESHSNRLRSLLFYVRNFLRRTESPYTAALEPGQSFRKSNVRDEMAHNHII